MIVPVEVTDSMVDALKQEDGAEVLYTRLDEAPAPTGWDDYEGHASWKSAYKGPEVFEWLLTKKREIVRN